jgi:ankyrin repeat protein
MMKVTSSTPYQSAGPVQKNGMLPSFLPNLEAVVSRPHVLRGAREEISLLSLPAELVVYIVTLLDLPSRTGLTQTCRFLYTFFTEAQRKWWVFEKQYLALVDQYALACQAKKSSGVRVALSKLAHSYHFVLNRLLEQGISRQERKIIAHLAENFFQHFSYKEIKSHINQVLAGKPAETDWQVILEQLAEVNLHLCLTLMAMASPGFDPKNESSTMVLVKKKIHYPFADIYPSLVSRLPFHRPSPATDALAKAGFKYAQVMDNLMLNNARISQFFLQFRFRGQGYHTLLHFAVVYGYMEIVAALVQDHRCIDLLDNWGQTALISACVQTPNHTSSGQPEINHTQIIQALLALEANPNVQDKEGTTALMLMSRHNDLDALQLLLEHGAQVNLQDSVGETALFYTTQAKTARLLLAHGAKVNHQDITLTTMLMQISQRSGQGTYLDFANVLLEYGAQVNLQDKHGRTALMYASKEGDVALIQRLLDYQADSTLKDNEGNTALTYAIQQGHVEAERMLRRYAPVKVSAQVSINAESNLEKTLQPLIK